MALARACAPTVAVSTLAAVAWTESDFDPLALHDNTARISGAPTQLSNAVGIATRLIAAGHSVDLGLMQVNSANLPLLGLTVPQALDPCRSLEAGAMILSADYAGGTSHPQQQAALRVALSRYNSGSPARGFANGYVGRVEAANAVIVPALDAAPPTSPLNQPPAGASATSGLAEAPSWDVFPSRSGGDAALMTFPNH